MKYTVCPSLISVRTLVYLCICYTLHPISLAQPLASSSAFADTKAGDAPVSHSLAFGSIAIPGPLRSFERMAGISQKASSDEVLPLLARNVYLRGYQENRPTEFLILLDRYVNQAMDLQILAGPHSTISVNGCDDAGTLLHILGYRLRGPCGQKDFTLETANPERAFITIDSGFPLVELEEDLQSGKPFTYTYSASRLPVLFNEIDWVGLSPTPKQTSGSLVGAILDDISVARLYWALSKIDPDTAVALRGSPSLKKLLPLAGVLDFYGDQICIRSGKVLVPGGIDAEGAWKTIAGASPNSAGEFVTNLLSKDNGWLAVYFDVLSRVSQGEQQHLTEPARLTRLYSFFRGGAIGTNAFQGVFPRGANLMVLDTRIQWQPDGEPLVPGDLAVWKDIIAEKSESKSVRGFAKRAHSWDHTEQVLEPLTALASKDSADGPLQIYMALSEIDRRRPATDQLSAETVRLLADKFAMFRSWYPIFTEFPKLNADCIAQFLNTAIRIDDISNQNLRGNALGAFQATVGLWEILARQGQIPQDNQAASWRNILEPYTTISTSTQLFDASRNSLGQLLLAAGMNQNSTQEEIVSLLAGPRQQTQGGQRIHAAISERISVILGDQRLASLDTLFALSDGLSDLEHGKSNANALLSLAAELREFDLPRPIFTESEKVNWAPPNYTMRHAELQVRTDLSRVIQSPGPPAQVEAARGQLAPFLRDTLVGLNYAYYEPPGAQMLHHNPLFVRSHDFLGMSVQGREPMWGAPMLMGQGSPAGGGAFLVGSLADLSYALATVEQDFIVPENVQALIWKDLVPNLLVSATLLRWWDVTPNELHAVTLYQQSGEELFVAAARDPQLREKIVTILAGRMDPRRLERVDESLTRPQDAAAMLPNLMPAETSYLAAEYRSRFPADPASWGPASQQLEHLRNTYPSECSWTRISTDFGVPHPALARTYGRELLNVKPFPFYGAYSSRLFGESWESSNLYWARLADEMGYSPAALNSLVPELSRRSVAKIFATEPSDWPAIFRAVQETGNEFRKENVATAPPAKSDPPAPGQNGKAPTPP